MDEHVLVIGAMLLDTKASPTEGLEPHVSNSAEIRNARGGTARNVAENLALLGADVCLISAVGDDISGRRLLAQTAAANVNTEYVRVAPDANTGSYLAVLDNDGTLSVALTDTRVMEHVTPDYLYRQRHLFRAASLIFFDGSLDEHTIAVILYLADLYGIPVCADPSSRRLTHKLKPHLAQLALAVPSEGEAAKLCGQEFVGYSIESSSEMAHCLNQLGVRIAVVTLSDFGFVYASERESGHFPAKSSTIVDSTGTGDAIAAAIMFGFLEQMPLTECMRLGAAAAGLTLQSAESVVPNLTLDMLYDYLYV